MNAFTLTHVEAEEKGAHLYWHWNDFGQTDDICEALGALDLPTGTKRAIARISCHAHREATGLNRPIYYQRGESHPCWAMAKKKPGYAYYTCCNIRNATDWLSEHGYIENEIAAPGTFGKSSELRARTPLIEVLSLIRYSQAKPTDPVILRDADGYEIIPKQTRELERMCARVDAQNELILSANFTSAPHLQAPIRRIFNCDMKHGGRFYTLGGSWLGVPNRERKLIRIDGEKMTLLDFSACHPHLAYQSIGQSMGCDPYELEGFDRKHCKLAFIVLLNAKNMRASIRALTVMAKFAPEINNRHAYATAIVEALTQKHAALNEAGRFFGSGLSLMKRDADIADRVMTNLRSQGIVTLPAHDGYMVKVNHTQKLHEAMHEHSGGIPVSKEF